MDCYCTLSIVDTRTGLHIVTGLAGTASATANVAGEGHVGGGAGAFQGAQARRRRAAHLQAAGLASIACRSMQSHHSHREPPPGWQTLARSVLQAAPTPSLYAAGAAAQGMHAKPVSIKKVTQYSANWVKSQSRMSSTSNQETWRADIAGRVVFDLLRQV
jgi:hypothetical protein